MRTAMALASLHICYNGSNNQQRINNNRITALEQAAAYISVVLKLHLTGTKSSP